MSAIDYKALAERVAQRAIYADNNADPNNKAWAADLRTVVSLLEGMAEEKPVAWRWMAPDYSGYLYGMCGPNLPPHCRPIPLYAHPAPAVPAGWKLVPVEPTPEMLQAGASIMDFDRSGWYDADVSRAEYRAMLAAAPTAPQAEQPIDLDAVAMQQMRQAAAESTWMPAEYSGSDWISDVCRWLRDGPPQAEPKREPTCLWSRADDDTDVWETSCGHAFTIIEGTPSDNHMEFCCYCGRRVDEEIGDSDAE